MARSFKPRQAYKGKDYKRVEDLAGDLHEDINRASKATEMLDAGLETNEALATAAKTKVDKKSSVLDQALKTSTGDAFTVTSWTALTGFEKAITTHGGSVKVHADVTIASGGAKAKLELRLTEDGVAGSNVQQAHSSGTSSELTHMSIEETFTPSAAGSHTYRLEGQQDLGASTPTLEKGVITVEEIRDLDP